MTNPADYDGHGERENDHAAHDRYTAYRASYDGGRHLVTVPECGECH